MHFLLHGEAGKYRDGVSRVMAGESDVAGFEKQFGPIGTIEKEWYAHVLELKRTIRMQKRYSYCEKELKLKEL